MNDLPRLLRDLQQRFLRAEDDRQVQAACELGGKILVRASKANLLGFDLPSVSATQSPSDDNSSEWAGRFKVALMVFGQQMQETFPGNPSAIYWENRETTDAEQLRVGSTKKQDWRIRAENYAYACGQIADLLDDDGGQADKKTDTIQKSRKKLPPNDVNDCIRYVRDQRKQIELGKRPTATKKKLIAEHLGSDDTAAMEKQLQPSRFGWLLDAGQADK